MNNPSQEQRPRRRPGLEWRTVKLVAPVLVAALAAMVLFVTTDASQPLVSVARAALALGLLGATMGRQVAQILRLQSEVESRAKRLQAVTEVVSALNAAQNVGGALEMTLERLVKALDANAGAVWLPHAQGEDFVLVEHTGFDGREEAESFLELVQEAAGSSEPCGVSRAPKDELAFEEELPGGIVAVPLGNPDDQMGYVCLMQWEGRFTEEDWRLLNAVGNDIGNGLRSVRLLSEARKLADHDPLTGLLNHRSAHQRLLQEVARAKRTSESLAVMMLDLDNFKLYNDTYGHPAGDEVLKRVTAVLRSVGRDSDVLARYGGDEFLLILPGTNVKQATKVAERIRKSLGQKKFKCQGSAALPIAFSYGIASMPDDGDEPAVLVSKADANLYVSKNQGGNAITATNMPSIAANTADLTGFDMLQAMVTSVDNKDRYTARHSQEVVEYSLRIAREMGLPQETLESIRLGGLLHDVGKIGVPDSILRKPGRLTDEEFSVMRQHPSLGALIVGAMPGLEHLVDSVRHHHERWDGKGYPDGLARDAIPLVARIMAVADAYSAMTTSRPYRKGMTRKEAIAEVERCAGTQFDPETAAAFLKALSREAESAKPARSARRRSSTKAVKTAA